MDELKIRKVGNLFQLYADSLHTVFQSHKIEDVRTYAQCHFGLVTCDLYCNDVSNIRFGRLCNY